MIENTGAKCSLETKVDTKPKEFATNSANSEIDYKLH